MPKFDKRFGCGVEWNMNIKTSEDELKPDEIRISTFVRLRAMILWMERLVLLN